VWLLIWKEEFEHMDGENAIGYWLFYAQRCVSYAFAETLSTCCKKLKKPYEVTPPQFGVLEVLSREKDGLTVGALAQRRALDAPTVTGIIKRLQQNGLVQREHDSIDRRIVRVSLTAEGCELYWALREAAEKFSDIFLQHFSEADRLEFLNRLQLIIANLSTMGMGVGDRFLVLPEQGSESKLMGQEGTQLHE
jgi:DNA-binding MarR family transcriptional regulator